MKTLLVLKQLMTCRPRLAVSLRWATPVPSGALLPAPVVAQRNVLRDSWDAVFSQLTTKILVLTTGSVEGSFKWSNLAGK